jgi:chromosomal replication initiation ATPase DnaA
MQSGSATRSAQTKTQARSQAARAAIFDVGRKARPAMNMSRILIDVAANSGCQVDDLLGRSRLSEHVNARRQCYLRLMHELGWTVARLSRTFRRSEATINEAIGRIHRKNRAIHSVPTVGPQ